MKMWNRLIDGAIGADPLPSGWLYLVTDLGFGYSITLIALSLSNIVLSYLTAYWNRISSWDGW